ncbi:MAG TPA: endonuclease/exonuclease/phosphatase family protein [Actinomycetales bacterium]|nr:endonuclease/exonuclease/phosphatase family protein [Actinomycetales bacterium]
MLDHEEVDRELRVLTWNVRNHLGDPLAVQRVLRDAAPDVACLQEVSRWPGSRSRVAALARGAGLLYTCGGRASAGTALLTSLRTDVRGPRAVRLPTGGWPTRSRGTATAVVRLPGTQPVRVASVHLGLDEAERAMHVTTIMGQVSDSVPLVVAGDLNEPPDGPSWVALTGHVAGHVADTDAGGAPTFPAAHPRVRIDAVLADARLEVIAAGWPDGVREVDVLAASDHRPVLAVLRLPLGLSLG